jgi:hypothetical protein
MRRWLFDYKSCTSRKSKTEEAEAPCGEPNCRPGALHICNSLDKRKCTDHIRRANWHVSRACEGGPRRGVREVSMIDAHDGARNKHHRREHASQR